MGMLLNEVDSVFLLEWALLCLIMVVASYTTYTDISYREIPNWATWTLLGLGLMGHMGLWVLGKVSLLQIGLFFCTGLVVGYLLFMYGFWGAGDAKLYWAMVTAMPSTLFGARGATVSLSFFSLDAPIWALLVNAILVNTVFILGLLLVRKSTRSIRTSTRKNEEGIGPGWLRSGVEAAGLSGVVLGGVTLVGGTLTLSEAIVVGAILYLIHEDRTKVSHRVIWVLPGLAIGVYSAIGTGDYLIYLVLWAMLWIIRSVYVYIHSLEHQKFVHKVSIDALQPGMILHQSIYEVPAKGGVAGVSFDGKQESDTQALICKAGKPLTVRKVRQLKDLKKGGMFQEWSGQLEVELSLPFAPFLMVGVGLTLVWSGSIIGAANRWIQPLFDVF